MCDFVIDPGDITQIDAGVLHTMLAFEFTIYVQFSSFKGPSGTYFIFQTHSYKYTIEHNVSALSLMMQTGATLWGNRNDVRACQTFGDLYDQVARQQCVH